MLFLLRLDQKKPYRYYLCFWGALSCHVRNLTTSRTDADAPLLWPPDVKSQLIGKDSDAGKDQGQEQKVAAEDETVREHHHSKDMSLNKLWGDSEGQGILVCCSPCIANSQTLLSE